MLHSSNDLGRILRRLGIGIVNGFLYSFLKDIPANEMRIFIEDSIEIVEYVYCLTTEELENIVTHNK